MSEENQPGPPHTDEQARPSRVKSSITPEEKTVVKRLFSALEEIGNPKPQDGFTQESTGLIPVDYIDLFSANQERRIDAQGPYSIVDHDGGSHGIVPRNGLPKITFAEFRKPVAISAGLAENSVP